MKNTEKSIDKLIALCKGRGYIFAGSEIYGGLANTWDYGPLGAALKANIKAAWLKKFVQENPYNVGLDSAILMNPKTWEASGHLKGFSDPLTDCRKCKTRHRADHVIEEWVANRSPAGAQGKEVIVAGWDDERLLAYINDNNIPCPNCGSTAPDRFTDIRHFNLMFKTFQGVTDDSAAEIYLRPETAQGIFVNFANVLRTTRRKIPFGIAQVGKSFRNEITPGNFIFRTREFEQMELEFFCKPGTDLEWFKYWKDFCRKFLTTIGLRDESIRMRDHSAEELCFYSTATTDFEFLFPFGWGELWGVADRTDYDLTQHMKTSGKSLEYFEQGSDTAEGERYIPYVIEPSLGVERTLLAVLTDAFEEETLDDGSVRTVLRLHPFIAPVKAAVLPLSKKLAAAATPLYESLLKYFPCEYDDAGAIGKRYRRFDEIGTPFCVTYDFESENDGAVTIRERDSMKQERVPVTEIRAYIESRITI